ncbi:hypothetical protein GCM10020001_022400 [Nonomuraea salmonea]
MLCEKPAAPTLAEALVQAAASEASGRLLMISQSRRYYAALAEYRQLIGRLGPPGLLTTSFFRGPRFGGFRDEMDQPLLVDMAIHAFDAARYLLGADPVSVTCESWNPPWSWYRGDASATATFQFEGGVRYVYNGSWCADGLETSWNGEWRAVGPGGSATWDGEQRVGSSLDGAGADLLVPPGEHEQIAGGRWWSSSRRCGTARCPRGRSPATSAAWPWWRRRCGRPRRASGSRSRSCSPAPTPRRSPFRYGRRSTPGSRPGTTFPPFPLGKDKGLRQIEQEGTDMGTDDKFRNKAQELKGRAKENVGDVTDDEELRAEGRADQTEGGLKQAGEKIKDAGRKVKDTFKKK